MSEANRCLSPVPVWIDALSSVDPAKARSLLAHAAQAAVATAPDAGAVTRGGLLAAGELLRMSAAAKSDVDAGSALAARSDLMNVVRQPEEGLALHSVTDAVTATAFLGRHFHHLDDAERCQRRILELARSLEVLCTDADAVDHRVIPWVAIQNTSSSRVEWFDQHQCRGSGAA